MEVQNTEAQFQPRQNNCRNHPNQKAKSKTYFYSSLAILSSLDNAQAAVQSEHLRMFLKSAEVKPKTAITRERESTRKIKETQTVTMWHRVSKLVCLIQLKHNRDLRWLPFYEQRPNNHVFLSKISFETFNGYLEIFAYTICKLVGQS